MSELIWKLLSALLVGLGVGCSIWAGMTWDGPDTVAALFGGCALAAVCFVAAIAAWDRTQP